ncbi:MAG: magnesium transporter, partial [Propionibacteriaceae bacterium]|nr:magnesium transporter [Propionibacteriaceae bacterium]
ELLSYYEDLSDHLLRATEWGETLRELVSTVHETNLALNDARMNAVMKKMAAWAGLVAVPTLITGWFGMNVPYPGFAQPWGFWLSTTVIIGAVAGIFVIFRRNDWF